MKYLLTLILLVIGMAYAAPNHPVPDGTFIQWHLCKDWDDAKWQTEFNYLRRAGMRYIVFAPTLDSKTNEAVYPSKIEGVKAPHGDLVENILRNAKKAKFQVFLGLNSSDDWWKKGVDDREWILGQMKIGNQVADELMAYKKRYPKTFHGWYWVWEVDNLRFSKPAQRQTLAEAIDLNVRHVKSLDPTMPFMLCPFMNYAITGPKPYRELWEYVFANTSLGKGDIFCPQDCVGAGGLILANFVSWFKELREAVNTKPGLLFWSDAETFVQRDWSSAPLSRFVEQIHGVKPYVDNIITFAYSHYYSPNNVNPSWQKAYEGYVQTGALNKTPPPAPTSVSVAKTDKGIELRWAALTSKNGDLGYEILRNGVVLGRVQVPKVVANPVTFVDEKPTEDAVYTVRSFDVIGNVSAETPAK